MCSSDLRACIRVKATAAEATAAPQEACLAIRPKSAAASSGLSLTISTLHEPVAVGKELTYVIQATNNGRTDEEQVAVKVTVPSQMLPVRLGTTGDSRANFDTQANTVTFDPVDRLPPGETLTYRLRVQAREQTADARVKAEVTSRTQRQLAEARTTIVGGQ